MGLSSLQVLAQGAPVVVETLFNHYFNRKKTVKDSTARSELLFDEAFTVMKAFLEIATKSTVEDLQRFSNTHIPSPPSILVVPMLIPLSCCSLAAGHLVEAFGGVEEARRQVGGSEWWQVRGLKGVEAEWIVVKRDWAEREKEEKKRERERKGKEKMKVEVEEENPEEQMEGEGMDEMKCMLYIHGGAYYWGSINTHRYTIWRYARKMKGRAFAVNYRKAPQYPFPCALQDALAAYLYLLYPPPEAKHRPVPSGQIVIAGDSAGGGLTLALLCVIRDSGLPMPSGAVAISPWSDLTHCFPSTMTNFATDVMPPYGFIHKPSTLWPPPAPELSERVQSTLKQRIKEAAQRLHHDRSNEDDSASSDSEGDDEGDVRVDGRGAPLEKKTSRGDSKLPVESPKAEKEKLPTSSDSTNPTEPTTCDQQAKHDDPSTTAKGDSIHPPPSSPSATPTNSVHDYLASASNLSKSEASKRLHPHTEGSKEKDYVPPAADGEGKGKQHVADPSKDDEIHIVIDGEEQVIRGQIQQYATNQLLPHPYVSPAFGFLGGLCPLLVIASDKELLRDEIIYVAHKAAHPDRYPIPEHVKEMMPRLREMPDRYGPTQVHLQVWDEVCHVLPLYSMTTPAKYCFRSIANFCKFVMSPQTRPPSPNPLSPVNSTTHSPSPSAPGTPMLQRESDDLGGQVFFSEPPESLAPSARNSLDVPPSSERRDTSPSPSNSHSRGPRSTTTSSGAASGGSKRRWLTIDGLAAKSKSTEDVAGPRFEDPKEPPPPEGPETAGHPAVYSSHGGLPGDPFIDDGMIRERISTRGIRRPLEPESEIPALQLPLDELGKVKELPAKRYLTGQTLWDKKFAHAARRVERHRLKNLKKSQRDATKVLNVWQERLAAKRSAAGDEEGDRFLLDSPGSNWAWALKGEKPPPSAVVSRRDTGEAVKLAKIADETEGDSKLGGVNLWTSAMDLLTRSGSSSNSGVRSPRSTSPTPPKSPREKPKLSPLSTPASGNQTDASDAEGPRRSRTGSRLAFLRKPSGAASPAERD